MLHPFALLLPETNEVLKLTPKQSCDLVTSVYKQMLQLCEALRPSLTTPHRFHPIVSPFLTTNQSMCLTVPKSDARAKGTPAAKALCTSLKTQKPEESQTWQHMPETRVLTAR